MSKNSQQSSNNISKNMIDDDLINIEDIKTIKNEEKEEEKNKIISFDDSKSLDTYDKETLLLTFTSFEELMKYPMAAPNEILKIRENQNDVVILDEFSPAFHPTFNINDQIFKINLTRYQESAIAAILSLENKPYPVKIKIGEKEYIAKRETSVYSIKLPLGSGKTLIVIALSLLNFYPKRRSITKMFIDENTFMNNSTIENSNQTICPKTVTISVKEKNIINASFVMCNTNVLLSTWKDSFDKFNIPVKPIIIKDYSDLKKFLELLYSGEKGKKIIEEAKFVICPYNETTGEIEDKLIYNTTYNFLQIMKSKKNSFSHIIHSSMTELDLYFSRVFYDDYDTANEDIDKIVMIPGIIQSIISATGYFKRKEICENSTIIEKAKNFYKEIYAIQNVNRINTPPVLLAIANMSNDIHQSSINFDKIYIEKVINLLEPVYRVIRLNDPYIIARNIFVNIITDPEERKTVCELINSSALCELGKKFNTNVGSLSDIVSQVLGKKIREYEKILKGLAFIEKVLEKMKTIKKLTEEKNYQELIKIKLKPIDEFNGYPNFKNDDDLSKNYLQIYMDNEIIPEYEHPNLKQFFKEKYIELTKEEQFFNNILTKTKNSLEDGSCGKCTLDLRKEHASTILKCCSTVICDSCTKNFAHTIKSGKVLTCPKCIKQIDLTHILIIPENIDTKKIIQEKIVFKKTEIDNRVKSIAEFFNIVAKMYHHYSKVSMVSNIVLGNIPKNDLEIFARAIDLNLNSTILSGNRKGEYVRVPKDKEKYLIIANYTEIFTKISEEFKAKKINYVTLEGTASQMQETITKFRDDPNINIMFLNSLTNCSGLNLQFVTSAIITHTIFNMTIYKQLMARMHRFGGSIHGNVNCYFVLYDNEPLIDNDTKIDMSTAKAITMSEKDRKFKVDDVQHALNYINLDHVLEIMKNKNIEISEEEIKTLKKIRDEKIEKDKKIIIDHDKEILKKKIEYITKKNKQEDNNDSKRQKLTNSKNEDSEEKMKETSMIDESEEDEDHYESDRDSGNEDLTNEEMEIIQKDLQMINKEKEIKKDEEKKEEIITNEIVKNIKFMKSLGFVGDEQGGIYEMKESKEGIIYLVDKNGGIKLMA